MKIRKALGNDGIELMNLFQKIGYSQDIAEKRAIRWANSKNKIMHVLEFEDKLIGYSGFKLKEEEDEEINKIVNTEKNSVLNWIGIDPPFRHKGFGSMLVNSCDDVIKNWDKEGIWLCCREKVLQFYKVNNYKIAGSYEHKGQPRFVMLKTL